MRLKTSLYLGVAAIGIAVLLAAPAAQLRAQQSAPPGVSVGDSVRVRASLVAGHVRMPAYVRGKTGLIVGQSPAYPYPDAHGHGVAADKEVTYDVRFNAMDLWRDAADPAFVHVGLFHSYLEPA